MTAPLPSTIPADIGQRLNTLPNGLGSGHSSEVAVRDEVAGLADGEAYVYPAGAGGSRSTMPRACARIRAGSRQQDVAIPELDALRAYRAQFAALVKQLNLPGPEGEEPEEKRGPMTRSEAGTKAATARWHGRR